MASSGVGSRSRVHDDDPAAHGGVCGLRVAIIGAGVSGLAACKHFTEQGLNATVFEGKSALGGVWRASYPSTRLQSPKSSYVFSDFPWPESVPTFPSHHQVVHYLECYARHFGFVQRIHFNAQVVKVKKKVKRISEENRTENFIWEICVRRKMSCSTKMVDYIEEWLEFDYLVMCCGQFGDVAKIPSFPASQGPEIFGGQVLHSLQYSALDSQGTEDVLKGKKVIVVGFQKTAIDVAVEVADISQRIDGAPPCTLVFRRSHWMYPRHRLAFGLFPFAYLFGTRLSEYWTPKPGQGLVQSALQLIFSPMRSLVWRMLEYYLRLTIPLGRFGLVPEHSLFEDLSTCILPQLPQNLVEHLESGRIIPQKTPYWGFYQKGIQLANGIDIEADVVILCTGYAGDLKLKAILPKEYRDVLLQPEGLLTLYRGVIHPRIPNMGFLGYHEGLSSVHSSEMGAIWLAKLLQEKLTLPDNATMEKNRRNWLRHLKITTPFCTRSCVAAMQIWHTDKLCQDMGSKFLRKHTWWQEIVSIYSNSDYKSLP